MGAAIFHEDEPAGGVHAVGVEGELDISNAAELGRRLMLAVRAGGKAVVVDLTRVSHMDSSGLAELLAARERIGQERLVLVIASDHLRRMLEVRGVDTLFTVASGRDEALAAVAGA